MFKKITEKLTARRKFSWEIVEAVCLAIRSNSLSKGSELGGKI